MERTQELSLRIGGTNYILSNSYAASFWFKGGANVYQRISDMLMLTC